MLLESVKIPLSPLIYCHIIIDASTHNWEIFTHNLISIFHFRSFCRLFYPIDPPSQEPDKSQYAKWLPSKDYAVGYAKFMGFNLSAPVASMLLNFLLGKGFLQCLFFALFYFFLSLKSILMGFSAKWSSYDEQIPPKNYWITILMPALFLFLFIWRQRITECLHYGTLPLLRWQRSYQS